MWRLIVVTFGFMGFALYELSGGADYKPSENSRQHAALVAADTPVQTTPLKPAKPVKTTSENSDVQIVLASANAAKPTPRRTTTVSDAEKRLRLTLNAADTGAVVTPVAASTHGVTTVAANPDKIARLVAAANAVRPQVQPENSDSAAEQGAEDDRDLRKVKSSRVNMRQGPGKKFNVVAKLTRGTEVEVIRDNGDGWVKLRVLDSGRVGWMADFLLISAK